MMERENRANDIFLGEYGYSVAYTTGEQSIGAAPAPSLSAPILAHAAPWACKGRSKTFPKLSRPRKTRGPVPKLLENSRTPRKPRAARFAAACPLRVHAPLTRPRVRVRRLASTRGTAKRAGPEEEKERVLMKMENLNLEKMASLKKEQKRPTFLLKRLILFVLSLPKKLQ